MAIEKRWINWTVSIVGAILLVFSLAQLIVSFYMNVESTVNTDEKIAISGALLVSLGVLLFPTAWIAFCSAISRHRGVYIAHMVMVCLSILDAIGMLVYQVYSFDGQGSYRDAERGIAITMTVLQCILILILIFQMSFGAAALCVRNPMNSYQSKPKPMYGYPAPPYYNRGDYGGMAMSLPRAAAYDYPPAEPRVYYSKGGRY